MRARVCVCVRGSWWSALRCVSVCNYSSERQAKAQHSSAQLSSTAQGQTPDSVSTGPDTGGDSGAGFGGQLCHQVMIKCNIIIVLNIAALFVFANLLGGFTIDG